MAEEWMMFFGSFIFMISDCLIGISEFYMKIPYSQVANWYQTGGFLSIYVLGVDHVNLPGGTAAHHHVCHRGAETENSVDLCN